MKTKNLLFGALAMLALSACSDDKNNVPDIDTSQMAYIRVNILGNSTSIGRAEGDDDNSSVYPSPGDDKFQYGSSDENEINSAVLVFYDANGSFMTKAVVNKANETQLADREADNNTVVNVIYPGATSTDKNVEVVKTVEASVSLSDGIIPSYMMVFANPINNAENINWNLKDFVKGATLSSYRKSITVDKNETYYYTMNNSVYFDDNKNIQRAVPVSRDNFYQAKAKADENPAPVDVYLDRVAAKVSLTMNDEAGEQSGELEPGTTLKFVVTGWGLNAVAKEAYVTKSFFGRSYDQISLAFFWNDPDRFRSYWAISPHYNEGKYPFVSDQVVEDNNSSEPKFTLTYRPFDQITREFGKSAYTLENTVFSSFYSSNDASTNNKAALISVIVAGYYTTNGNVITETDGTKHGETFYIYGEKFYNEVNMKRALAEQGAVVGKMSEGKWVGLDNDDVEAIFKIAHPKKPVVGDVSKGIEENKVTVQLIDSKLNNNSTYYYKNTTTGEISLIRSDMIETVNAEILANTGLATAYTDGYAYFNVPIRHLAPEPTGTNSWGNGSFGVVRNHHYMVNVTGFAELSLKSLGHGVFDPKKPIVPPSDPNDEFGIKANIKVLSWRLVNQNVVLGK